MKCPFCFEDLPASIFKKRSLDVINHSTSAVCPNCEKELVYVYNGFVNSIIVILLYFSFDTVVELAGDTFYIGLLVLVSYLWLFYISGYAMALLNLGRIIIVEPKTDYKEEEE